MHIEHFIAGKDRHLIYVDIGDTVHDEEIIAPCLLIACGLAEFWKFRSGVPNPRPGSIQPTALHILNLPLGFKLAEDQEQIAFQREEIDHEAHSNPPRDGIYTSRSSSASVATAVPRLLASR